MQIMEQQQFREMKEREKEHLLRQIAYKTNLSITDARATHTEESLDALRGREEKDSEYGTPRSTTSAPTIGRQLIRSAAGLVHGAAGLGAAGASGLVQGAAGLVHGAGGASGIVQGAAGLVHGAAGLGAAGIVHSASGLVHGASDIVHGASDLVHGASDLVQSGFGVVQRVIRNRRQSMAFDEYVREALEHADFEIDASYGRSLLHLEDNRRMAQLQLQTVNPIHNMLNHRSRLLPPELQPGYHRGVPLSIPVRLDLEHELEEIMHPPRRIQPPKLLALTNAPVAPLSLPAGSSNDGVDVPVPTTQPRVPPQTQSSRKTGGTGGTEEDINKDDDLRQKLKELCKTHKIKSYGNMKNTTTIEKLRSLKIPIPYT